MKESILILDDDQKICDLLKKLLKKVKGIDCIIANDPIEALYKIENQEFTYIIVDYHLKLKSGIDFIRGLKRIEKYKNLKYILMSSNIEKRMVIEAVELGVKDILVKPFTADELCRKLVNGSDELEKQTNHR